MILLPAMQGAGFPDRGPAPSPYKRCCLDSRWLRLACLLRIAIAHAATAQVTTAATEDSGSGVGPFLLAWIAAWNAHDADAIMLILGSLFSLLMMSVQMVFAQ